MIIAELLKQLIPQGETTTVQFKIRSEDAYKMGAEMVAFSNTQGGILVIGVNDKTGAISGLSFEEIQQTNALLVNAASENVKPAIIITTETVSIDGQNVIVAAIPQGKDKPYKDNKGIIWVKNGADKRKVFSNTELRVMLQSCGALAADKDSVEGTSYRDISVPTLKHFLYERYKAECEAAGISNSALSSTDVSEIVKAIDVNFTIEKLLQNISLMDEKKQLTLSGLLLLGNSIQRYKPIFTIKCISFVGNTVGTTEFRDKMPDREMAGNLLHQYKAAISFINRNLKTVQVEAEFNTLGRLEIPMEVFVELLTNALIHRDYYQNAPIRLFIFDNRIEICSPGILPDSVTEEAIKQGISRPRNQLLFGNAKYLLPYTGIGSGIIRAMRSYEHINFRNDYTTEEFIVTAHRQEDFEGNNEDERKSDYDEVKSDYDGNKSDHDSDYDEVKSDYDENKSDYDSDHDEVKSDFDENKSDYDSDHDEVKSDHDEVKGDYDENKSDYDNDHDEAKSDHDEVKSDYDENKSDYDNDHDEAKSDHDEAKSVHDEVRSDYDKVRSDYDKVKSDYDENKSDYDSDHDDEKELKITRLNSSHILRSRVPT
ncbi:MAG: putative DNA binding domain-containing protein, partial [Prevotellaceae bacterium]|nr:putative DNA binding domain-containing protein [Prevotellaceae bacterium]